MRLSNLKALVYRRDRNDRRDTRQDWQSLSNLGNAHAALSASAQIIDIAEKIRGNKNDCEELVTRIVQLMDLIRSTLEYQNDRDIDFRLKEDLERLIQCKLVEALLGER
ncbi:hypothetical protein PILCRDRAFT_496113 [Piloderma croceum F 1598]|uniref:Uncharacterized protein n=1 Tax=Piloderma croceum (strain F 1598) TaxID=765440 RepID=A0A0C3FP23_PILCF|nr:hypothetical protein PILCRDRAFT_496113 [Piloderma croceum F 1598]